MGNRVLLFLVCIAALAGAGLTQTPAAAEPQQGYLIGPGDEITAKVLGEPQFDFVATVDQDGRIEVPFVDQPINATCRSERDLRSEVSKLLSKYLRSPQVSIRVTQRNSRPPVSVYGEVREQQRVTLTRRAYLLDMLSFAGGVTEKSGGMIQVFRTKPPMCSEGGLSADWKAEAADSGLSVPSRLYSLASLRQGMEEANPEIFPGDIIVVQKAAPVYVTGEVIRPSELSIPEGGLPLTQAIAMASGITREAKTKNVKIYRRKQNSPQPEVLAVNYDQIRKGIEKDVMLEPFDIVEVDKAKKSIGDILLEAATGIPNRLPIPIRPF
jgi:polysaccharide export outer membrane protein